MLGLYLAGAIALRSRYRRYRRYRRLCLWAVLLPS
ncbi:MAG: hypothetical protein ACI81R_002052, partial [Bradymonadia bacterium]